MIETWLNQDLQEAVHVRYLDGNVFSMDNNGNKIGVNVFSGGEPVTLSGSISANVIRSDGATVVVSGESSENSAWVVLPQAAYAVPGVISVVIKNTVSSDVTTLGAVVANVYQSTTDTTVDPGQIIPSVQALITSIETAVASIPADYSSLWTSLAPAFDSTKSYVAGQYVTYNGGVYRFTTAHSGSWVAADATAVNIGGELYGVKRALAFETGNEIVDDWDNGKYYKTNSTTTNIDLSTKTSTAGYACTYRACSPGDIFYYTGYGTSSARSWAFLKSNGDIISRASAGWFSKEKLTAPANAAYVIFNIYTSSPYLVIKGEPLVNRVGTAETNIQTNATNITNLGNTLDTLFTSKSATGTGEIIDEFLKVDTVSVGSAESVKVATAQMFEAKYPGVASQYGVSVTKNSDGTYTINGTATSNAWFFLNQETRTGTSNRVVVNGRYSFGYDIVSGSFDKGTYEGSTPGIIALIDLDDSPTQLASLTIGSIYSDTYDLTNKAVAMAFRLTTGVIYKNLRIAIRMNKGEKLFPYAKYVTPTTLTSYGSIVSTVQNYTPYIWLTSTPNTETLTVSGKVFNSEDDESSGMNLYGVLEKYNDRVDILAQMFTNPLFLVYTDIHGNADNLARINKWYSANKPAYISDIYCLGDMVDDQYSDASADLAKFDEVSIWGKTLKVIGNHDVSVVAGTGPSVSATDAYSTYIAPYVSSWGVTQPSDASTYGKSYYYKDYANKVRVIVLDTYFYTEAQHTWFVETLESARTNNLAVIVAEHEDICNASEKQPFNAEYPFAKKHDGYTGLQCRTYGDGGDYQTKRNAVNSFIGDGGEFICWMCGHQHADMSGTYDGGSNGKQASILLSNASNSMISSMRFNNYSQDCFTYVGIDTTIKYLYLLRIGEAVDKWFHQNLFMVYDYANHQVVEYH